MAVEAASTIAANPMFAEIAFYLSVGTAILAAGTLMVGYSQMRIASAKIRLDLYNKRFAVYVTALEYFQVVWDKRDGLKEKSADFIIAYRESRFLFSAKDGIYDTLTRIKDDASLVTGYDESKKQDGESKDGFDLNERVADARLNLHRHMLQLEDQMNDYIDFKVVEGWSFFRCPRWLKKLWRWAKNRKKK